MRVGAPPSTRECTLCTGWFGDDEDGRRAHLKVMGHAARTDTEHDDGDVPPPVEPPDDWWPPC